MTLDTKFNHKETEAGRYQKWLDKKLFQADITSKKEPFTIVLPPPNVTGKLHLGHAWDTTLQDILIRYKKMQGFEAMWIAGMDHAGIATQAKVDERLRENGSSAAQIGRTEFTKKAWEWKEEYATHIRQQWGKLGLGLDYSQERFTLDPDINKAVNKVFVDLYNKGYIYQGYRITNWDCAAKTALSDIEVIHKEVQGKFYHFKYMLEGTSEFLEVATTRPETIFADGAVAVHPDDETLNHLVGKYCINPADKRRLLIIADEMVEIGFGSGAVKISGAHDPNDFDCCKRHPELEMPIVMNLDGTMNELCLELNGIERFKARQMLVDRLDSEGLLIEVKDHVHNVGHSERTNVIVEPMLTKQWYVKMDKLAENAIENQKTDGKVDFYPNRFEDTFMTWMENVNDWCISRQLWWGHQIPAWYHKTTGEIYVGESNPGDDYIQDQDVLDTWFSSALWPFATTIWADKPSEIARFYETDVLVTGYDIIFFWVSRMIFQALEFTDTRPFKDVLIHGLIRDSEGRKMSKSLGNGIDPMDVIEKYGADTLRFFLTTNSAPGQDLRYSEEKLDSSWNFINKIWNVSRFCLTYLEGEVSMDLEKVVDQFDASDFAIINNLNLTITHVNKMMDRYEFGEASRKLYNFIWEDFANWYVEIAKISLNGTDELKIAKTQTVLKVVLTDILKMLHPYMPFVTDKIYEVLHTDEIVTSQFPQVKTIKLNETKINNYAQITQLIVALRNLRQENDVKPSHELNIVLENTNFDKDDLLIIEKIGKVSSITTTLTNEDVISLVLANLTVHVKTEGLIDVTAKLNKLTDTLNKANQEVLRSLKMLSNEKFIEKASDEKITLEKDKARSYIENYQKTYQLILELDPNITISADVEQLTKML